MSAVGALREAGERPVSLASIGHNAILDQSIAAVRASAKVKHPIPAPIDLR